MPIHSDSTTLVLQILELAGVCGGCDTVCMLSNIMCYCTDDATADFFTALLSPVSNEHIHTTYSFVASLVFSRSMLLDMKDTVCGCML
eukprot:COSAG02_NODE_11809_length_1650_cov_1.090264_4_plen_88_part_00